MRTVMEQYLQVTYLLRTFGSDLGKQIIAYHETLRVCRYFVMNEWGDRKKRMVL